VEVIVNTVFEIPPRPPWSPVPPPMPRDIHLEPPEVTVEPEWEYHEVVRDAGAGLMRTEELDALGAQRWELVGVIAVGDRVHFYFKRVRHR
jgi:hypothetical protein